MRPRSPETPGFDSRWMADAACARFPALPWTTTPGTALPRGTTERMREICAGCPVLEDCSTFVDLAEVNAGWWAGSSRNNRGKGRTRPNDGGAGEPA
jgi:hypothetical protein